MMIDAFFSPNIVQAIGWSLLHSLWQGTLLAIVLAGLLLLMPKFSADTRYLIIAMFMALFVATIPINFVRQYEPVVNLPVESMDGVYTSPNTSNHAFSSENVKDADNIAGAASNRFANYFEQHLPLLVTLWLLGMLIFLLRYLGQLVYVQRLKHHGVRSFPSQWNEIIDKLEQQLKISMRVRYFESLRISTPMTIGWLKPVVLFPVGLVARLTPAEVEFILLHELAHIKRNDYLINILQSLVTILLFFHPAAWWMSRLLHQERENCCDDLVVRLSGQRNSYASTLINLQEQKLKTMKTSLAITGTKSGFSQRILRLLNDSIPSANRFREGFVTALVLIAGVSFLAATGIKTAPSPSSGLMILEENSEGKDKVDMLIQAIDEEDEQLFQSLLDQGVAIDGVGSEGWNPLCFAAAEGRLHFAGLLLDAGADVDYRLIHDGTQLIIAARRGDLRMVALLLESGADVNRSSPGDGNPLIMAAAHGHAEIVTLLVEHGADVDAIVEGDETPLINAARNGHLSIVKYLVSQGADVNLSVLANKTTQPVLRSPLNQAIKYGHTTVEEYLRDQGAEP